MADCDMQPIVVIVGQTATGKSELAMHIAQKFGGEIITADSRTVYRGMDIGTAKPTASDQKLVKHYGIDVVEPNQPFTAADFQQLAQAAIESIRRNHKVPIIVGGTGLYIDALLYNFTFRPVADSSVRRSLNSLSIDELQRRVQESGLSLPRNYANGRQLVRLLESGQPPLQPKKIRPNTLLLGLQLPKEVLRVRITQRVRQMVAYGFIDEVARLIAQYGPLDSFRAPGYNAMLGYIEGRYDLETAIQKFINNDVGLAKRQLTWFKRNKQIHWLDSGERFIRAESLTSEFLRQVKRSRLL